MAKTLAAQTVTIDLADADLSQVIEALRARIGLFLDATDLPEDAKSRTYRFQFEKEEGGMVLAAIARHLKAEVHLRPTGIKLLPIGIDPVWEGEEVYVGGLARAGRILDEGGPRAAPLEKVLPVEFEDVALEKALREISSRIRIPIAIDPRATAEQRGTRLSLTNDLLTVARVLDDVTAAARLTWAAEERRVLVTFDETARAIREERRQAAVNAETTVSVAFRDTPLFRVVEEIDRQTGVPVIVDRALWEPDHPKVTLRMGPVPLGRLLRSLAPLVPARSLIRGEAVYLVPENPR